MELSIKKKIINENIIKMMIEKEKKIEIIGNKMKKNMRKKE